MKTVEEINNLINPVGRFTGSQEPALGAVVAARTEIERALEYIGRHRPRSITGGTDPNLRQAVIERSREAARHLGDALSLDAPADAVEETRHALEELQLVIKGMTTPGAAQTPLDPYPFEQTVARLKDIEHQLESRGFVGFG